IVLVTVICIGLEGHRHIVLGHAPTFLIALATIVWITFVGGISTIFMNTITMKTVPTSRQGAFFGVITMVSNTSMALSMGVAGWLVELFAPRPLSIYVGWTYICFTILYAILFTRVKLGREKRYLNKNYG